MSTETQAPISAIDTGDLVTQTLLKRYRDAIEHFKAAELKADALKAVYDEAARERNEAHDRVNQIAISINANSGDLPLTMFNTYTLEVSRAKVRDAIGRLNGTATSVAMAEDPDDLPF